MNKISPKTLQCWLLEDGSEVAVLDVREAGQFGVAHLLFGVPLPYSVFELELERLVPNRTVRLVVYDDGLSGVAERSALRATALGYEQVYVLEGGTEGWTRAGYELFAGVNVPSKVFGELVEEAQHTPSIKAEDLNEMLARDEPVLVLDGRPFHEYQKMNIPGSICCPNGELAYRVSAIVKDDKTPIVVNCAGRTRSIIGAQTLRELGIVRNPIFALENGTQGWALAGLKLEHGSARRYPAALPVADSDERVAAAAKLARDNGVRTLEIDEARSWLEDSERTTYLLDIRTPEEFENGSIMGASNAPGGQLVQATDHWLAVQGSRVLLLDFDGVRAPVVAQWLRRLGWDAHTVRVPATTKVAEHENEPRTTRLVLTELPDPVTAETLESWRRDGQCLIVDVRPSMEFRRGHIPGSIWSIRPRIEEDIPTDAQRVVLVGDEIPIIQLAMSELKSRQQTAFYYLEGGYKGWVSEGRATSASPEVPSDEQAIDYLFFVHDRHDGNLESARQYLAWEQGLISQLEPGERARFNP